MYSICVCVFQTMDVKGAEEAVVKLNGYKTSSTRHLVVEKYVRHTTTTHTHVCPSRCVVTLFYACARGVTRVHKRVRRGETS